MMIDTWQGDSTLRAHAGSARLLVARGGYAVGLGLFGGDSSCLRKRIHGGERLMM